MRRAVEAWFGRALAAAVALVMCAVAAGAPSAQVGKLLPVDEADRDPTWLVFRARFLEAIRTREVTFLERAVDPRVKLGFGGDDGFAAFRRTWHPERADSPLWSVLGEILSLGGRFQDGNTFAAPYVYAAFGPPWDAFAHGVVVGENVRVRSRPDERASVLARLSFDVVPVTSWGDRGPNPADRRGWVKVRLKDGRAGYVAGRYVMSPVGWRAIFAKRAGEWRMEALVSGD